MKPARELDARYAGTCTDCGEPIAVGDPINYRRPDAVHRACTLPDTPTTTQRERMEARAEKRESWAETRAARAAADLDRAHDMASIIPMGQPILVGHHSEGRDRRYRGRIDNTMRRGVEGLHAAENHASKADGIRSQLAGSIYDDDPDAVERLAEKLAGLEAERDRWNAYNKACRKAKSTTGPPADALALLDDDGRAEIASLARIGWWSLRKDGSVHGVNTNRNKQITTTRQRLARLERVTQ